MPTLEEIAKTFADGAASATHLLLIGHTKYGKSDYCAQAAKDGFELLYIDNDNGLTTLLNVLKDDVEAQRRVHHFTPADMPTFIENLLTKSLFRYNVTRNTEFTSHTAAPTDKVVEFVPGRIPQRVILCIDTWTANANALIRAVAEKNKIDLTDMDTAGYGRTIYGGSGIRATNMLDLLQHVPFHVIVQAHPGVYERKEKPPGVVGNVLEKDMIIKETIAVPISTSLPHGATLGKYFNQIGWLGVNRANQREIDFKLIQGRIGGGTPNSIGDPRTTHSFVNLFGKPRSAAEDEKPWKIEYTAEEFEKIRAAQHAAAPKLPTSGRRL